MVNVIAAHLNVAAAQYFTITWKFYDFYEYLLMVLVLDTKWCLISSILTILTPRGSVVLGKVKCITWIRSSLVSINLAANVLFENAV